MENTFGLGRSEPSHYWAYFIGVLHVKVQGDQWKRKEENISVLYKTYPASRLFPSTSFYLKIYFSRSSYGIGKQEKGPREGAGRGRWNETREFLYYFFMCPFPHPIQVGLGEEDDILGSHFLD